MTEGTSSGAHRKLRSPVMTVEATLEATGVRLVLGVEGYQYPQFDTGWDANWLVCDVQLDVQDQLNSQDHARPFMPISGPRS